jgi:hypothetical protein
MPYDLSRLSNLPPERTVENLAVGGNQGEHGGVIVKLAFQNSKSTETITFLRAGGIALATALSQAAEKTHIPNITKAERRKLAATIPTIEDYDWNLHGQKSRIVGAIYAKADDNGIAFEFIMRDGTPRRILIPPKIARFLGEYLYQYRPCLDDPQPKDDK